MMYELTDEEKRISRLSVIRAIKAMRERTGCGLLEAKHSIDEYLKQEMLRIDMENQGKMPELCRDLRSILGLSKTAPISEIVNQVQKLRVFFDQMQSLSTHLRNALLDTDPSPSVFLRDIPR